MSSQLTVPPPGFDELSYDEQLDYVERLLNYASSGKEYAEIPDCHRKILEEQLAYYREVGFKGTPWEEFQQELDKEFFQAK